MPELDLLPELGPNSCSCSAIFSDAMMSLWMQLELQMRYRAVWHGARNNMIRRASLEHPDARNRCATRAGFGELSVLC
eukprot:8548425-Pyramimonas_sp.AAC.1